MADPGSFLTAEWRDLAMLNYEIEPAVLRPFVPADDSEEAFITEHYWGYARQRDDGTVEYRVEHPRWAVWRATAASLDCDVAGFYGPAFTPYLCGVPASAFIADGSPIVVRRGVRLDEPKGARA